MIGRWDVLCFAEDPGAAVMMQEVPVTLRAQGWEVQAWASGKAVDLLPGWDALGDPGEVVEGGARHRLVVVGTSENPASPGLALIAAARQQGITSVAMVDARANAAYRFRGPTDDPLAYVSDWLIVPDRETAAAYIALGFSEQRVAVLGHPRYDGVLAERERLAAQAGGARERLFPGCRGGQRVVVFVAEPSDGLNPEQFRRSPDYTLTGTGRHVGRTEIVLDTFLAACSRLADRPYLVLRLHPKNTLDTFPDHAPPFDRISQAEPALSVVYHADLVVGMTSMLLQEAALLGRPTLSILPRAVEKAWLPSIATGLTPCVTTEADLEQALVRPSTWSPPAVLAQDAFRPGALGRTVAFLEDRLSAAP